MRVLLDTNVALDLLLLRDPWFTVSAAFWQAIREGDIIGIVPASAVTDNFCIFSC
jgi:predicted nucleic acid-binding protein